MPKRRAHGEGGLFARHRGTRRERWVARVYLPDGTRREVSGRTQAEARKRMEELKQAASQGIVPATDRTTVGEFLREWLEHSARPSVRPGTLRGYRTIVTMYLVPRLGRIPLAKLSPADVQRFQNELLKAPHKDGGRTLSTGTVLNARRVLGRAMEQAARWGLVPRNPVRLVEGPHVTRKEITPLDPEQARQLVAAIEDDRLAALYTVALALGLRRGEALGLTWQDVDFDGGVLHVRRALQRVGRELKLLEVKTKKSRRSVSLPQVAVRALRKHRERQDEERRRAGDQWAETGLVFTSPLGAPLDPQVATRGFRRALHRAGLPHQRFHDLRHACASLLLAQGLDLKVIQEILGHSTITITANLYAHVLLGLKRQAASHMDAVLGDGGDGEEDGRRAGRRPAVP